MNLETAIEFLERIYDNPEGKNLSRLEHEALGEALRRLQQLVGRGGPKRQSVFPRQCLRLVRRTDDQPKP